MIVNPDFLDDWRTRLLTDRLNDPTAPFVVLRLWAHCQVNRTIDLGPMTSIQIKYLCRFDGDADTLVEVLTECQFIERSESGRVVVASFEDANGRLTASWVNGARGGRPQTGDKGITQDKPKRTQGEPKHNPRVTQANPSEPKGNPAEPKPNQLEENRRERIEEREENRQSPPDGGWLLTAEVKPTKPPPRAGSRLHNLTKVPDSYPDDFETFWEAYPRKYGKADAFKVWPEAMRKVGGDLDTIIEAARQYAKARAGEKQQYTKTPANWLAGGHWTDTYEAPKPIDEAESLGLDPLVKLPSGWHLYGPQSRHKWLTEIYPMLLREAQQKVEVTSG